MNGARVSLEAVEAAESAESYFDRIVERLGELPPVAALEMRRRLRRAVQAAVETDAACVGAVRKLRRNVDLPDTEPPAALAA